jgi:FlaA1/EpsC-like NDP-sugar epimerase
VKTILFVSKTITEEFRDCLIAPAGKVSLSDVRELDLDDLLGREPVKPNGLLINRNSFNKTVLVTGAGGSIGSEL